MLFEVMMRQALILMCFTISRSSSQYVAKHDNKDVPSVTEMQNNSFTYMNITEEMTRQNAFQQTQRVSNESMEFKNTTDGVIENDTYRLTSQFINVNELHFSSTTLSINKTEQNTSFDDGNQSHHSNIHSSTRKEERHKEQTNKNHILTVTTQSISEQKKVLLSKELLYPNIPYHIENGAGRIHSFTMDRKKIPMQHHLQLVPMEDEPLGSTMLKDQQYLISVLVPIGIGMIGAAMIVGTVFTLRYVARKRALESPFDNGTEVDGSHTPCISSISTETTDKMFLLLGDDEI